MASLVEDRTFTKPRVLKRVIPTNIGSESFEEGDYCFRVSNFDDYVYFSLTEFDNGVETPMDLTTFGDIFLKFISGGSAIEIPSVPNLQNIEAAKGEVVFKIDKSSSESIIRFPGNNFSIVSKMVKGTDYSFESVLFQGLFLKPNNKEKISARFNSFYNQQVDQTLQTLKSAYDQINSITQVLEPRVQELAEIYTKEKVKEQTLNLQFTGLNKTLTDRLTVDLVATQDSPTGGVSNTGVSNTGLENLGTQTNLPTGGGGRRPPLEPNTNALVDQPGFEQQG